MFGAHIGPRSRSEIEDADVVFFLLSERVSELWILELRPDARSLQPFYAVGKPRTESYREMVSAIMEAVRAGFRVCGVFYGHPGVFAGVAHRVVAAAREEGFEAEMHPAVSAEDCLYADLGIDPGTYGCQHYEASQLMFYRRRLDASACLVIWQIAMAGDRSVSRIGTGAPYRRLLIDLLVEEGVPRDHEVIVYEAATLPICRPRMDRIPLHHLEHCELHMHTTLVVPPARPLERNHEMLRALQSLEEAEARSDGRKELP